MVPSGWQKTSLEPYIDIKHGFAFKSEFFRDTGVYILLTPGSFYEAGGFRDQAGKTKYYNGVVPDSFLLSKGDLLIAMTEQAAGLLGSPLFVPEDNRFLHNQRLGLIQVKSLKYVCKEFLYLIFNSTDARRQISEQSTGTKVKHTSPKKLMSVFCLLPPIMEQWRVAKIISTWDKAIGTTERLINNSKQQKKALMQQLLTGKKRLLDDLGKPFAGDWKEVKLENVAVIIMGSSPKSSSYNENKKGLPLIQGNADIKNRKSVPRICTSEVTKTCHPEDILLSVRAPVGTVAKSEHEACIGRGISSIKARTNYVQEYLYQWLLWFEPRWEQYSQGSTFEAINSNDIKLLDLTIPCQPEQLKIASVLANADKEIFLLEQQLSYLKQEKKALMQQLLTGKRRIKVDNKEVV
jgi:type I restriction enzyme S subunit